MRCKEEENDAKSKERRVRMAMGEPHAQRCWEELAPGEGQRCEMGGNLERRGHAGAMMMLAFKTLSRILFSAKAFP
jgi:hypothetical protein